jgi:hypothetical protein
MQKHLTNLRITCWKSLTKIKMLRTSKPVVVQIADDRLMSGFQLDCKLNEAAHLEKSPLYGVLIFSP